MMLIPSLRRASLASAPPHHAGDGLAGRRASAATVIAYAVLHPVGVVGVRGAVDLAQFVVVLGVLVAGFHTMKPMGQPVDLPSNMPERNSTSSGSCREEVSDDCPGAAACQFGLHEAHVDVDARGVSVDDSPDAFAVRLAEARQAKDVSK